jgi:hypothetical protein
MVASSHILFLRTYMRSRILHFRCLCGLLEICKTDTHVYTSTYYFAAVGFHAAATRILKQLDTECNAIEKGYDSLGGHAMLVALRARW